MSLILNIETSSTICSLCLSRDGEVIALKETSKDQNHASVINILIEELFKETKSTFKELSAVAVSAGPGSYTGLRIGISTAKGICYTLNIPLIAIDSLEALANGYIKKYPPETDLLLCPMIDARRMEVYYSLFTSSGECIIKSTNIVLDENFLSEYRNKPIHFFGSGAQKVINFSNNHIIQEFQPSSSFLSNLSFKAFHKKVFADTAYFEPNYIKPVYFAGALK